MKKILLFLSLCSSLQGRNLYLVNVPVAGVYVKPDQLSAYDSQKIYGHPVEVLEEIDTVWVKVTIGDGITGYCLRSDITPDHILWRTDKNIQRVKSLQGCIYPTTNNAQQTIIRLPYNAYVKVLEISEDKCWTHVELIDGRNGWIKSNNIEPISPLTIDEAIKRSKQFLGLPYIWGGTSSEGYDCSGFVQTLAQQMGYPMLRDACLQAEDKNLIDIPYGEIQPGDFIYFGREKITHTAFCIGENLIIHAAAIEDKDHLMITKLDHPGLHFKCARRISNPPSFLQIL